MVRMLVLLAMVTGAILGSGCVRESQKTNASDFQIELSAIPFPAAVGETRLVVYVTDRAGQPVDDARLAIKGDMTHAGMLPVLAEQNGGGEDGYYSVPFEWTMAGDWLVTVEATLADGSRARQRFDIQVLTADEALCTDEYPQGKPLSTGAAD